MRVIPPLKCLHYLSYLICNQHLDLHPVKRQVDIHVPICPINTVKIELVRVSCTYPE